MFLRTLTSRRCVGAAGTISFRPSALLLALLVLLPVLIQACSSDSQDSVFGELTESVPANEPRTDNYVPDLGPPWQAKHDRPSLTPGPPREIFALLADWYERSRPRPDVTFPEGHYSLHTLSAPEPDEALKKQWAALKKAEAARKKKAKPKTPKLTHENAEEQFQTFAHGWLEKLNRNYPNNAERLQVKVEGGFYFARYRSADKDTLEIRVKPTESSLAPFVGVLSYLERNYYCMAVTEEQARQGPFHIEAQSKITEIFSYGKKGWHE